MRDNWFVIVLILGFGALALWPAHHEKKSSAPGLDRSREEAVVDDDDGEMYFPSDRDTLAVNVHLAKPKRGVPHKLLPLVAGSEWVYKVTGPKEYVKESFWRMKLESMPTEETPGKLLAGFGTDLKEHDLWFAKGFVRIDTLPFVEPVEFIHNQPEQVTGELIPPPHSIAKHSIWNLWYQRSVLYRSRDKNGVWKEEPSEAKQSDRATGKGFESVVTPAGRFRAFRINWVSRLKMNIKGRPVLEPLTTQPFRKESMWLAEGIGIVSRKIVYSTIKRGFVNFELVRYTRPDE